MTPSYRVLPAADQDLNDQATYLASEAGLELALRFFDAAALTFEKIARQPGIGERREFTDPRLAGLRIWRIQGFKNHLIFYRQVAATIEIIRVLHGARDIAAILADDFAIEGE